VLGTIEIAKHLKQSSVIIYPPFGHFLIEFVESMDSWSKSGLLNLASQYAFIINFAAEFQSLPWLTLAVPILQRQRTFI
jgi:hypothetical protein